jgi:hypothetical protein
MPAIGVMMAFSIMASIASATAFRVDLPLYPGAQQIETSSDSEHSILTFVTDGTEAHIQEFYKETFSPDEWYYIGLGNETQQICCYMHIKTRTYRPNSDLITSLTADYNIGIDILSDGKNTLVTVTATRYNDFYNVDFDYSP